MHYLDIYDSQINPSHLNQGDIFTRFDDRILPPVEPKEIAFMVLNYTCDLINLKDLTFIFICPIFKLDIIINKFLQRITLKHPNKSKMNIVKELVNKTEKILHYEPKFLFFLTPTLEFGKSPVFADLLRITTIPVNYISNILESRIKSLKSPWREKLGWRIGYIFNRVALPDIKTEKIEKYIENHKIVKSFLVNSKE